MHCLLQALAIVKLIPSHLYLYLVCWVRLFSTLQRKLLKSSNYHNLWGTVYVQSTGPNAAGETAKKVLLLCLWKEYLRM